MDADDLAYISAFATERDEDDAGVVMQFDCPSQPFEVFIPLSSIIAEGVKYFIENGAEFAEGKCPGEEAVVSMIWGDIHVEQQYTEV